MTTPLPRSTSLSDMPIEDLRALAARGPVQVEVEERPPFPLSEAQQDAILEADYVVSVYRYPAEPEGSRYHGAVGFHALTISSESRFGFTMKTLGLYPEDKALEIGRHLELIGSEVGEGDPDGPALFQYIGDQICPLEWKSAYAAGDRDVRRRFLAMSIVLGV